MDATLAAVYGAYVIDWSTGPGGATATRGPAPGRGARRAGARQPRGPRARRPRGGLGSPPSARTAEDGSFVPLAEQDPSRWDTERIARAHGTSGQHTRTGSSGATSSRRRCRPSTARAPHRTHRLGDPARPAPLAARRRPQPRERDGPGRGDRQGRGRRRRAGPPRHPRGSGRRGPGGALPAGVGDPRRAPVAPGRRAEAVTAYARAVDLTHTPAERRFLESRRDALLA